MHGTSADLSFHNLTVCLTKSTYKGLEIGINYGGKMTCNYSM